MQRRTCTHNFPDRAHSERRICHACNGKMRPARKNRKVLDPNQRTLQKPPFFSRPRPANALDEYPARHLLIAHLLARETSVDAMEALNLPGVTASRCGIESDQTSF